MKRFYLIIILVFSTSFLIAQEEDVDDQYQDVFVVIVNTSNDYYELRTEMFKLSNALNMEIDTMGRGFEKSKNLICLSEDNEDEIYAGDYFPRRSISNKLSLEYLTLYIELDDSEKNTIALLRLSAKNKILQLKF